MLPQTGYRQEIQIKLAATIATVKRIRRGRFCLTGLPWPSKTAILGWSWGAHVRGNPMITIEGRQRGGLTRRGFLTAGACGFSGLTLAGLLRAEAAAGIRSSHKA